MLKTYHKSNQSILKIISNSQKQLLFQVYPHQVSGKQPKLQSSDNKFIFKGFNQIQYFFYKHVFQQNISQVLFKLKQFLPKFYGKFELKQDPQLFIAQKRDPWLVHLASRYKIRNTLNSFIILQNLTQKMVNPNIFDIKIGGRNIEGKKHKITKSVSQFCIKLNGWKIWQKQLPLFFTKYYLGSITNFNSMKDHFGVFFMKNNKLNISIIQKMIKKLLRLKQILQQLKGYRFISSSICLIYDNINLQQIDVKLIDFGRLTIQNQLFKDQQSIKGVESIIVILKTIILEHMQLQLSLNNFLTQNLIFSATFIPEHKKVIHNQQQ